MKFSQKIKTEILINCIYFIITIHPDVSFAKNEVNIDSNQDLFESLREQCVENRREILDQKNDFTQNEEKIKFLANNLSRLDESIRNQFKIQQYNFEKQFQIAKQLEQKIKTNNSVNKAGTYLILLALLFEIPGAIILGGTNLANSQPHVFTLKSSPDLLQAWTFGYEKLWDGLSFLGLFASFFLIIGFVLQTIGISIILSFTPLVSVLFCIVAIILCFFIVYLLLGQSPDQSRKEKIKIFYLNCKRLFRITKRVRCDYCSRKIKKENAEIWYADNNQNRCSESRYKNFHVGHKCCLLNSGWYTNNSNKSFIHKINLKEFHDTHETKLNEWFKQENEGKKFARGNQYEFEYKELLQKLNLFK